MSQRITASDGTLLLLDADAVDDGLVLDIREPAGDSTYYPTVGVELSRQDATDLRDALSAWLGDKK
jgi:hypothetical protein